MEELEGKEVGLRILDFAGSEIDTKSPTGKLMLTMFAAMAQFAREMMLERQRLAIQRAKKQKKYTGRAPVPKSKVEQVFALKAQDINPPEIAKQLSLGRSTVYRLIKQHG